MSFSSLLGINRSYESVKLNNDVTVVLNLSEHHPNDRDMIEAYGKSMYRPSTDGFGLAYVNRPGYVKTVHDHRAQAIEKLMTEIKEELYRNGEIAPAKKAQLASLIDQPFVMAESDRQDPEMLENMKRKIGSEPEAFLAGFYGFMIAGVLIVMPCVCRKN